MKLISMREFVLEKSKTNIYNMPDDEWIEQIINYAKFLSQPLTLGMFVPCDEKSNVLTEPMYDPANEQYWAGEHHYYNCAKGNVLFNGFTVDDGRLFMNGGDTPFITRGSLVFYDGDDIYQLFNVEDIVFYGEDPELTQSAIKQLGL